MTEIRELLDREVRDLRAPEAWEPVQRRRLQRHRRRRVGAALVAFAVAGVGVASAWLVLDGLLQGQNRIRPGGGTWVGGLILYDCDGADPAQGISGSNLCAMRPDGSERRVLIESPAGFHVSDPAWSPDGSRLAYRSVPIDRSCGGCGRDLFVADADGSNTGLVIQGHGAGGLAWSPDSKWIAFGTSGGSLAKIHPDGTGMQTLSGGREAGYEDVWPAWSPDGSRIAFGRLASQSDRVDLFVMESDGSKAHPVVSALDVGGTIAQPVWSPDGRIIAFVAARDGESSIWAYDGVRVLDGDPKNVPFALTTGRDGLVRNLAWIDGGAQVAYLHDNGGTTNLEAVRLDDGRVETLVAGFPATTGIAFQPPPGGAGGACVDPGPPEFISCSEAVQRAAYEGGTQGSRVEATLVQDDSGRWVWAVRYVDVHADDGSQPPEPVLQDWVMEIDARTGKFAGEHPVGPAVSDPNPLPEQSPA